MAGQDDFKYTSCDNRKMSIGLCYAIVCLVVSQSTHFTGIHGQLNNAN